MKREQIVLPADVYDTLEFSALVCGGIGAELYVDEMDVPCCVVGHAMYAEDDDSVALWKAVTDSGLGETLNDEVVEGIRKKQGRRRGRVTWPLYVREGNIVRGAA